MSYETLLVERRESAALITFNRPDKLNPLSTLVVSEALDAVAAVGADPEVRSVVLTGAGRSFIAGADIAEMQNKSLREARAYSELGHRLMQSFQDLSVPVIAAINGFCLGGGLEVALACDIRLASTAARFGLPETILGVIPGWGGTQRTARLIGPALTKELIFTGQLVDPERALQIGLVNRLLPPDDLLDTALEMTRAVARQNRYAIAQAKQVINTGVEIPLATACAMEIDAFNRCFATEDRVEGMTAFLEKRTPVFTDR